MTKECNYILILNKFNELCQERLLSRDAQMLYYKLFWLSNKRNSICKPILVRNEMLMMCACVNKNQFYAAVKELQDNGLIKYAAGKKGTGSTYTLIDIGVGTKLHGTLAVDREEAGTGAQEAATTATESKSEFLSVPAAEYTAGSVSTKAKRVESTSAYGEFRRVRLTETEYEQLAQDYGPAVRDEYIRQLDWFVEEKKENKKVFEDYQKRNHNMTIRNWINRAGIQKLGQEKNTVQNSGAYDMFSALME